MSIRPLTFGSDPFHTGTGLRNLIRRGYSW